MYFSSNLENSAVSVVSDEVIFYVVSKIRLVSIVSGVTTFYVVSKISTVSVVTSEFFFLMQLLNSA